MDNQTGCCKKAAGYLAIMKVWKYISVFMAGMALSFALAFWLALKKINVTNADTVIESLQQSIKKLKQDGDGNVSDLSSTVNASSGQDKTKRELRKEKREQRKQQKRQ